MKPKLLLRKISNIWTDALKLMVIDHIEYAPKIAYNNLYLYGCVAIFSFNASQNG
jgi:hypothetical protein